MAGLEGKFNGENRLDVDEWTKDEAESPESDRIYRNLFYDDYDGNVEQRPKIQDFPDFHSGEVLDSLFANDFAEADDSIGKYTDNAEETARDRQPDLNERYDSNEKFESDGNTYETDDNGTVFKINDELKPATEYSIDGIIYKTDGQGRIISCDGYARQTPDGERDSKAQKLVGGEDRREGDQGGHILSRILGGSKGIENLIPIRGTINNGPYKTMENEINQALSEGKDAHIHVDIKYDGDSKRPSQITVIHTIDGKETRTEYDNDEGSIDLLDSVEEKIDKEQYDDLKQEISDANADGGSISIIAVRTECNRNGDITKVTVTMRDENGNGPNEKRVLIPKEDGR